MTRVRLNLKSDVDNSIVSVKLPMANILFNHFKSLNVMNKKLKKHIAKLKRPLKPQVDHH